MPDRTILALPSKGAIAEPTYSFLKDCGLRVHKPNPRQYIGSIPAVPAIGVLFQRVKDVVYKVADGTAHLGITGLDVVYENQNDDIVVIHDKLGYGHCQLVVAVPEAWVDVQNITDLAEVALDFRENHGRNLRVATTYPQMTRKFLHSHQIHHFTMVKAEGAIEAAPTIGYADIVVDLTQTGTTLRENHLKQIDGGTIAGSQACLIGNRHMLETNQSTLDVVKTMTEYIDAALNGKQYYQITVDVLGETAEEVAQQVASNPLTRGLLGPTVSPIYNYNPAQKQGSWHTVTITVSHSDLLPAITHLREIGGTHAIVAPVKYVFLETSHTYARLLEQLKRD